MNAISALAGTVSGPTLRLENGADNRLATALELRVAHDGITPMRTNSTQTVPNLSADSVDGRDAASFADGTGGKADDADKLDGLDSTAFYSGRTYGLRQEPSGDGGGELIGAILRCDEGDKVLNGGYFSVRPEDEVISNATISNVPRAFQTIVQDNDPASGYVAAAQCADFPPLRQ